MMEVPLSRRRCVPCAGGVPPLEAAAIRDLLRQLGGMWRAVEDHHLEKEYEFLDFEQALEFVARVGALALREGHYPDLHLCGASVRVAVYTHKVDGLTESDFVLASKIDEAF